MEKNRVKLLFEDMTLSSNYQLLEWGKDDDELRNIAAKKDIQMPSKDISIFKCRYAMVDKENRNKCTLPRKEVKKALKTLVGKAIDKDHLRKNTIGFWLDSQLDEDEIIAYGAFWKSNFPEDYQIIQDRLSQGKMKISFEAWGDRNFRDDGSYDLNNIEFAGGALLFDTEPAFPDAEVMEFSANRVLEFAKVMATDNQTTTIDKLGTGENNIKDEGGNITIMEIKEIKTLLEAASEEVILEKLVDFQGTDEDLEMFLASELEEETEDSAKMSYETRKGLSDDDFAVVITVKNKVTGEPRKIRMYPMNDEAHVRNALARLGQAKPQATLRKLGVSVESVKEKIMKRAKALNMTELVKRHEKAEVEETPVEVTPPVEEPKVEEPQVEETKVEETKVEEPVVETPAPVTEEPATTETPVDDTASLKKQIEELKLQLENAKLEIEKVTAEAKLVKEELGKRLDAEKAAALKSRRDELGEEFAKLITDEDIMDDLKFENAKLKKELAALKNVKPTELDKGGLDCGAKIEKKDTKHFEKQNSIRSLAFPVEETK